MSSVISIMHLTKYYGDIVGIDDLNLEIHKGEIFGFLGQNGAGKTTTIRCVLSILLSNSGEVHINGQLVSRDAPEIRAELGYLPGEIFIKPNYTVRGFLAYINALRTRAPTRLAELVERFSIPLDKKIGQLSKGNKQKVGIALAFMNDPEILILDEPSAGLDPIYQQELYDFILEEKARGKTIFFSSHNLDEVQKICDRVAIIRKGKLVSVEDVHQLAQKVPRKLTAKVANLNVAKLPKELIETVSSDEVKFTLTDASMLSSLMSQLVEMGLQDLSYPPASLEEYFLAQYTG